MIKGPDIIELANTLRADTSLNRPDIVRTADWIVAPDRASDGIEWLGAQKDLNARLPAELREDWMRAAVIAKAARGTGKPLGACTTQEMETLIDKAFCPMRLCLALPVPPPPPRPRACILAIVNAG